jgi:hypothetical protein
MKVLTAQTMKVQTYTGAVENLLSQSVMLPSEPIRDAVRWRLRFLKERYEFLEIPKEEYEKLQSAIKDGDAILKRKRLHRRANKKPIGKICRVD